MSSDQNYDALTQLERFVVENDDLLELESPIRRFNIFDAVRIDRVEIPHSNFLGWLLDPAESHGRDFSEVHCDGTFCQSPRVSSTKVDRSNHNDNSAE